MSDYKCTKVFDKMIDGAIKESGKTVATELDHIKHLYHSRAYTCVAMEQKLRQLYKMLFVDNHIPDLGEINHSNLNLDVNIIIAKDAFRDINLKDIS